jgi:hypothetical protein
LAHCPQTAEHSINKVQRLILCNYQFPLFDFLMSIERLSQNRRQRPCRLSLHDGSG